MKNSRISLFILIVITGCLVQCGLPSTYYDPYYVNISRQKDNQYYAPTATNAPLLANKDDISFSWSRGFSETKSGGNLQAAYLPGKHVGIMTNYSYLHSDNSGDDDSHQNRFEFGAGYVNKLSEHWLFESYGGLGFGKMSNQHYTGFSTVKSSNYFLQPSIAVGTKEQKVQLGFISRFNLVNFKLTDTTFNNDREPFVTDQMKLIVNDPVHIFWEPGFVFRAGWKTVTLQAGYQMSTDLTDNGLQYAKDHFSLGVVFRLSTKQTN